MPLIVYFDQSKYVESIEDLIKTMLSKLKEDDLLSADAFTAANIYLGSKEFCELVDQGYLQLPIITPSETEQSIAFLGQPALEILTAVSIKTYQQQDPVHNKTIDAQYLLKLMLAIGVLTNMINPKTKVLLTKGALSIDDSWIQQGYSIIYNLVATKSLSLHPVEYNYLKELGIKIPATYALAGKSLAESIAAKGYLQNLTFPYTCCAEPYLRNLLKFMPIPPEVGEKVWNSISSGVSMYVASESSYLPGAPLTPQHKETCRKNPSPRRRSPSPRRPHNPGARLACTIQ